MLDTAGTGGFAILVGCAWGLTGTAFIDFAITVIVDAIAEIVVGSGRFAFSPLCTVAEVGFIVAYAQNTSGRLVTGGEPILVGDVEVAFLVGISAIIQVALVVEACIKTCCGGTTIGW